MSDDNDGYEDDVKEFAVSYAQLDQLGPKQRAGIEGLANAIRGGEGMSAAMRRAGQLRIDPIDRFKILCSIYYDKFGGDKAYIIGWDKIIAKIPVIKWAQYKNPIGFVLGARVLNRAGQIEKIKLEFTCDEFRETMKTEGIAKEDVLRYARYWTTLLKN